MAREVERTRDGLRVGQQVNGSAVVVTVGGDIDLGTAPALRAELSEALAAATAPAPVVLDLTAVEFLGSAGLAAIAGAHQQAEAAGTPLRLVATQRAVLRPIELTGFGSMLALYPTVPEALAMPAEEQGDGSLTVR
jgi:anti-sigma B factor antagonist